jgi:Ca-activated chloride channel homolog
MFRFASPWSLLILMAVPIILMMRYRRSHHPAMAVSSLGTVSGIRSSMVARMHWLPEALKITALVLMVLAMARPQWGTRQVDVRTEGVNIVLAVDLSESMAALDFRREGKIVNRLEAVRGVVRDFVGQRDGDRIAMVVFGSEAYTQVPLTRDYGTITTVLEKVKIGAAGPQTAIGDAIGISLKRLEDIPSKSNVIILLTDGESNTGSLDPATAARVASDRGIKIHTIGVGSHGRAPFLVRHSLLGDRYVYRTVNMDENALKQIAGKTGGQYFRAKDTEKLEEIYSTIDAMEKTEAKTRIHTDYRELYPYFLTPAIGLLVLWTVLAHTRFLRVP